MSYNYELNGLPPLSSELESSGIDEREMGKTPGKKRESLKEAFQGRLFKLASFDKIPQGELPSAPQTSHAVRVCLDSLKERDGEFDYLNDLDNLASSRSAPDLGRTYTIPCQTSTEVSPMGAKSSNSIVEITKVNKHRTALKISIYITTATLATIVFCDKFITLSDQIVEIPEWGKYVGFPTVWVGTFSTNYLLDESIKNIAKHKLDYQMRLFSGVATLGVVTAPERIIQGVIRLSMKDPEKIEKANMHTTLAVASVICMATLFKSRSKLLSFLCPSMSFLRCPRRNKPVLKESQLDIDKV